MSIDVINVLLEVAPPVEHNQWWHIEILWNRSTPNLIWENLRLQHLIIYFEILMVLLLDIFDIHLQSLIGAV